MRKQKYQEKVARRSSIRERILSVCLACAMMVTSVPTTFIAADVQTETAVQSEVTEQKAAEEEAAAKAKAEAEAAAKAAESEAAAKAAAESEAAAKAAAESEAAAKAAAESEAAAKAAAESEAAAKAAAESEAAAKAESEKAASEGETAAEESTPAEETTEGVVDTENQTEAVSEDQTEAVTETEAETEAVTEAETETETETEAAEFATEVKQIVSQETDDQGQVKAVVRYEIKVKNTSEVTGTAVDVKVLLPETLSYDKKESETNSLKYVDNRFAMPEGLNLNEVKDGDLAGFEGHQAVMWTDLTIDAGDEFSYIFYADVNNGIENTEALRSIFYVNGEKINASDIKWENQDKLVLPEEVKEFVYEDAEKKVVATVEEAGVIPADAKLVVKKLSEKKTEAVEKEIQEQLSEEGLVAANMTFYDIYFDVNGEEAEPQDGTVTVQFTFKKAVVKESEDAEQQGTELKVLHIDDDNNVEILDADLNVSKKGIVKDSEFEVEQFSVFCFAEVGSSSTSSEFNNHTLAEMMSNFNVISFGNTNLGLHTMGGVVVKGDLTGKGSFWDEGTIPSYINGTFNYNDHVAGRGSRGVKLYVSSKNTVTNNGLDINGKNVFYSAGNGTAEVKNGYVDFDALYASVNAEMTQLSNGSTRTIDVTSDGCTIEIPAGSNVTLNMKGHQGVKLVLSGSGTPLQKLQSDTIITIPDSGDVMLPLMDQNQYPHGEDNKGCGLVFVCPNATGTVTTGNYDAMIGHVLAPNADINQVTGDYNGCLVGKNVSTIGEGHVRTYTASNSIITGTLPQETGPKGNLTISKSFSGVELTDAEKNKISFVISGPQDAGDTTTTQTITTTGGTYRVADNVSVLKMTIPYKELVNNSFTLTNIPVGTYTVTESGADVDSNKYSLQTTYKVNNNNAENGTVSVSENGTAKVEIGNQYTSNSGSLKLVKNFTGAELTADQKNSVSFTVAGPANYSRTVSYSDFTDGSYTLTDLKPGNYSITENGANLSGYESMLEMSFSNSEGDAAKVVAGGVTTATFTNEYTQLVGSIILSKTFSGIDAGDLTNDQKKAIQFTVTGPNNYSRTVSYSEFTNGEYTLSNLPIGVYTVAEIGLPSIENMQATVTINNSETTSATITVRNASTATAEIINTYDIVGTSKRITISKVDVCGNKIDGAEIKITDNDGNTVEEWTSDEGRSHDIIVEPGEYTFKEVNAPTGYKTVTDIKFTVDIEGNVTVTSTDTDAAEGDDDGNLVITDEQLHFIVNKTDVTGEKELAGAVLEIYEADENGDKTGDKLDSWISVVGKTHDFGLSLKIGKSYVLEETTAPEGYTAIAATVFSVGEDGSITTGLTKSEVTDEEGNSIYLVKNELTDRKVKFSKTDIDGNELAGASITVTGTDAAGKEHSESWVSDGTAKELELPMGTYTMTETGAPNGYQIATAIEFTVNADGTITVGDVTTESEDKNIVTMVDGYADQTVTISKVNAGGKEIGGAEIKVTTKDADGKEVVVDEWKSEEGKSHDITVKPGEYTLHEENAPEGYKAVTDITFVVDKDGNVTVTSTETNAAKVDENGNLVITDELTDRSVSFKKTDAAGTGLVGASITVKGTDAAGQKIEINWVSDGAAHELKLPMGSYTMTETGAPEGYGYVTDIKFSVEKDGTVNTSLPSTEDEDGNEVYLVKDAPISFNVNKTDLGNGDEIEGAVLTVYEIGEDKNGEATETEVDRWESKAGETHDFGSKLKAEKTYILRETTTPEGYSTVTDIEFTVAKDGTVNPGLPTTKDNEGNTIYLVKDKKDIHFNVNKTDLGNGEEVEGAELKVFEICVGENGEATETEVDSWISEKGKTHDFGDKLEPNKNYVLRESIAPDGYGYVTDIKFSVDEGSKVTSADIKPSKDEDGNEVYLVKDAPIKFNVNKTDLGNGDEIKGAVLTVYEVSKDENGKATETEVDSWESKAEETHDFGSKLKADKTYILRETTTPEGYSTVTDIEFTVAKDGTVNPGLPTTKDNEGNTIYLVKDKKDIHFNVNKTDLGNGEEVEGAELKVFEIGVGENGEATETEVDSWISEKGKTHDFGDKLEPNKNYVLRESIAPDGYGYVTDIKFSVDEDSKVTSAEIKPSKDEDGNEVYLVKDAPIKFNVNKTDLGNGDEIEGAELKVFEIGEDEEGKATETEVDSWTSEKGKTHDFGNKLKADKTYVLRETTAPDGYGYVTDIVFNVKHDGTIETSLPIITDEDGNEVYLVADAPIKFNVNKTDLGNGDEIEGAVLTVYEIGEDKNGEATETEVDSWESKAEETHDFGSKLKADKTYVLRETTAPDGYGYVTDIEFSVEHDGTVKTSLPTTTDEKGNIVEYLVKDAPIKFNVNKTDLGNGDEIEGAVLTVYEIGEDKNGEATETEVDSWESKAEETHDFGSKLKAEKTYILRETTTPEGYSTVTDIKFTVEKDGTVNPGLPTTKDNEGNTIYLVKDKKDIHFNVNKTDLGNGEEVEGAELKVFEISVGENGEATETEVDSWISEKGKTHDFGDKLEPNKNYVLRETVAPEGFGYVTDIKFSVDKDSKITSADIQPSKDEDGNEVYLVADAPIKFNVNKTDLGNGDEIEGAVLTVYEIGEDKNGEATETEVDSWESKAEETHDFGSKLKADKSYVLREMTAPDGYGYVTDIVFSVKHDGTIETSLPITTDEDGNEVYLVADAPIKFNVNKTDLGNGDEIEGAVLTVYEIGEDKNGEATETEVDSWESKAEETHDFGSKLKADKNYVLREMTAPDGYGYVTDIVFSVKHDGTIETSLPITTDEDGNEVYLVADAPIKFNVNKTDLGNGDEIEGAVLTVYEIGEDKNGEATETEVDSWESKAEETHDFGSKLKADKSYVLREMTAPDGYGYVTDIVFSVKHDGTIETSLPITTDEDGNEVFLVADAPIKFNVNKTDLGNGDEIEGAVLTVYEIGEDKNGEATETEVDSWESKAEETHDFGSKLKAEKTYILRETTTPEGYSTVTDIKFTVEKDGTVNPGLPTTKDNEGNTIYLVKDKKDIHFNVNKTDLGNGEEVEGAELKVFEISVGENGEATETEVDSWISEKGKTHDFGDKLEPNKNYVLRESIAPDGYGYVTDIKFSVDEGSKVTSADIKPSKDEDGNEVYLVKDAPIKFNVNKTDLGNGDEIEGAVLTVYEIGEDKNGEATETEVDSWESKAEETHDFGSKLKADKSYVLREMTAPDGYGYVTDIVFSVKHDGTIETSLPITTDEDGNEVYLVADAPIKFNVNKTDLGNGDEIEGAVLTVYEIGEDKNGEATETEVDSWESKAEETHDFGSKLKADKSYVLREMTAPDGYGYVTDIEFSVEHDGTVNTSLPSTKDEDGNEVYLVKDAPIKFNVNKTDLGNGDEIEGAELKVFEIGEDEEGKATETEVDSWTSEKGKTHDFGNKLKADKTYVLRETTAPDGYGCVTDIEFSVEHDGTVKTSLPTTTDKEGNIVEYLVKDAPIKFNVNKTDLGNGDEVEGAKLEVITKDKDGKEVVVDSWISKKDETHDFGLKLHAETEYVLRETTTPEGYETVTDIKFSVAKNGTVTAALPTTKDKDDNIIYLVEDKKIIHFNVNKTELGNGDEVEGAKLEVITKDKDGKEVVVDSWTSKKGETHDFGKKLEPNKDYVLRETVAPEGFGYVTDIKFSVDKDSKITSADIQPSKDKDGNEVYLVEDSKFHFTVNKTDLGNGEEVEGATIEVVDENGKVVDSWTSKKGETHDFGSKLEAGKSYTLKETVAPEGYNYVSDTTFSVGKDGKITTTLSKTTDQDGNETYLVEDSKIHFHVNKVDIGNGAELEGAVIQVLDSKGNVIDQWTSKKGETHDFGPKLKAGETYVLREDTAPAGYDAITDTTFTIDKSGKVTCGLSQTTDKDGNTVYLVEDAMTKTEDRSVVVQKTVSYNDMPLLADGVEFYVALYYDQACTKLASDVEKLTFDGTDIIAQAKFDKLEPNRTYYVGESDQAGNVIYSGEVESVAYNAKFTGTNGNVVSAKKNGEIVVMLDNQMVSIPENFYIGGQIDITKRLIGADAKAKKSDKKFYAGVFYDANYSELADNVSENIVELDLAGNSEVTKTVFVSLGDLKDTAELYVTEVTADGKPVVGSQGFAYSVSVDGTKVTIDADHLNRSVVITNTEKSSEEDKDKNTEDKTTSKTTTAVKTGDETPIIPMTAVTVIAGLAVFMLITKKKRERTERR